MKRILGLSSWKTLLRRVAHCGQVAKHNHCLSVHSDVTILDHSAMHSRKHRDGDQNGGVIADGDDGCDDGGDDGCDDGGDDIGDDGGDSGYVGGHSAGEWRCIDHFLRSIYHIIMKMMA